MPFSSNHPNRKSSRELPECENRETVSGSVLNLTIDAKTGELEPLDTYKVFLKRNLKWQAPPADLLMNIHARIERIKAGEE